MPEGDTIHRMAATLRAALLGARLTGFRAPRLGPTQPAPGETIDRIEARGKHLLLWFSGGLIHHSHMRMTGSWHLYRPGEPWRRGPGAARTVVEVPGVVAVCFGAPVVELLDEGALRRHPALRALGPDLASDQPDLQLARRRMERIADPATSIGQVLLDQRIACGMGNVYRSEVCFLHGLDPRTPLAQVDEPVRDALLATGARLLRQNLHLPARTTVAQAPAGTLYVYGRAGAPCRRCGTAILSDNTGEPPRITYWCPSCQQVPGQRHAST